MTGSRKGKTGAVGSSSLLPAMEIDMIDCAVFFESDTYFRVVFTLYVQFAV